MLATTTTALEPYRENIINRYSIHDLTPDQVVRYLNSTGIQTDVHVVKHSLRSWGVQFRQSALDIELEAPPRCENRSCTRIDGTKCITWRSLSCLSDVDQNFETETPLLSSWLASQDSTGELASDAISMGLKSRHPHTAFYSTDSHLSTTHNNVPPLSQAAHIPPRQQPTTPITISSLLSPKDTSEHTRYHDSHTFPYSKSTNISKQTDAVSDEKRYSASLLSPQSFAGPIRTRPRSKGRKRPSTPRAV